RPPCERGGGVLMAGSFRDDASDTRSSDVTITDDDGVAAIEAMAGWSVALDVDTQRLRQRVDDYLQASWLPRASEAFMAGESPAAVMRGLGSLGALGAALVGRGGRPALGPLATCAVMHAVEHTDGGLRCAVTIQDCVIQALLRFGDEEQRARWL